MKFVGRVDEVTLIHQLASSGASIDLVGVPSSGRSSLLSAVGDRLEDEGWRLTRIRGIPRLSKNPLAAVSLRHPRAAGNDTSRSLHDVVEAADALRRHLGDGPSAILVDDWQVVDELSQGVIESVHLSEGIPLLRTRLLSAPSQSGQDVAPRASFWIDVRPLRYEDMESVIAERLKGAIDPTTMSRIFAKSGGYIGTATDLVDAASVEGRLTRVDGVWRATEDLWSPLLNGSMQKHLHGLTTEHVDALRTVAQLGIGDLDTVRRTVAWETLETLEARGVVHIAATGPSARVTVTPPLLAEYFRYERRATSRLRTSEALSATFSPAGLATPAPSGAPIDDDSVAEEDAMLVRFVQERSRIDLLRARTEWTNRKTERHRVAYLRSLVSHPDLVADDIEDVFDAQVDTTDPISSAQLACLRCDMSLHADGDLDAALATLHESRDGSEGDAIRDAHAATLTAKHGSTAVDALDHWNVADVQHPQARAALRNATIYLLVSAGRLADEDIRYADYLADTPAAMLMPARVRSFHALASIARGDVESTLRTAQAELEEARSELDGDVIRSLGLVVALCHIFEGRYRPAERMLDLVQALGAPSPLEIDEEQSILNCLAIVATRRGNVALAQRSIAALDRLPQPDGPLIGQAAAWSRAQVKAASGDVAGAADRLWEASDRLWERGAHLAAALAATSSVDLASDADRLVVAAERGEQVQSPLIHDHLRFVQAVAAADAEALTALAPELSAAGRPGLAVAALHEAARLHRERGDEQAAADALATAGTTTRDSGSGPLDSARFLASTRLLSEREAEIVRLVLDGRTNPEIANRLVLSVRTIESHMARILKKLGVANRQQLRAEAAHGL